MNRPLRLDRRFRLVASLVLLRCRIATSSTTAEQLFMSAVSFLKVSALVWQVYFPVKWNLWCLTRHATKGRGVRLCMCLCARVRACVKRA